MTPDALSQHDSTRAIRLWLLAVAALIFAMVLVGGATRLTESGLSIVEWKPVTGTLPPLSHEAWLAEFGKYKTIPQYTARNHGMTLGEFQNIYWWEWTHRLLGRVIGAAFLLPFLFFLWRGAVAPGLRGRLWGLFALGGLQGGIGWWMVASGLSERTEVSQYRLAVHLTLACLIYAGMVWTLLGLDARKGLGARKPQEVPARLRAGAIALLVLVLVQIYLGALVAGLRAGLIYNTWPLMDGVLLPKPADLFYTTPWWRNLFENTLTVQFNHRMTAYVLWAVSLLHLLAVVRNVPRGPALTGALALAGAITVQAALGIMTLLWQVPIGLALLHQGVAMVVLTIAVAHVGNLRAVPSTEHAYRTAPPSPAA